LKKKRSLYKSGLEETLVVKSKREGFKVVYEPDKFQYTIVSHYTPDFKLRENVFIETKGYFAPSNRSRLLSFKEQYPEVTIYLVFQRPELTITKKSKTTYGDWATKHGFEWCHIRDPIPKKWYSTKESNGK
jgi:hypothetical protein